MQRNKHLSKYLSKQERQLYTERLLKLHEVIADSPPERYRHEFYRNHCGTAGCAIGHAMIFEKEFPGFKYAKAHGLEGYDFNYFGPGSYNCIFNSFAYDKLPSEVTKYDALQRIREYIDQVLGCKLIEINPDIPLASPPSGLTRWQKVKRFLAMFR